MLEPHLMLLLLVAAVHQHIAPHHDSAHVEYASHENELWVDSGGVTTSCRMFEVESPDLDEGPGLVSSGGGSDKTVALEVVRLALAQEPAAARAEQ